MITAEELYETTFNGLNLEDNEHLIPRMMRQFAKLHVKAALEAASENATVILVPNCSDHTPYRGACVTCGRHDNPDVPSEEVNEESILTAYPETNIV
jgi:hypothetical protein